VCYKGLASKLRHYLLILIYTAHGNNLRFFIQFETFRQVANLSKTQFVTFLGIVIMTSYNGYSVIALGNFAKEKRKFNHYGLKVHRMRH